MIYTIGYDNMKPGDLQQVMALLNIERLLDCRSVPKSRRAGFGGNQLKSLLGAKYEWAGQDLGGRDGGPTGAGLRYLAKLPTASNYLLLCKEEDPGQCHRHAAIAVPLYKTSGIDCIHIFRDQFIQTSEVLAALAKGRAYTFTQTQWPWVDPSA